MALTIASKKKFTLGTQKGVCCTVTFDSAYATGGESFTPAMVGLKKFYKVEVDPVSGYVFAFDYTNNTILAYRQSPSGTAVFTNSGSTSTFTNSGSTSTFTNSGSTFTGSGSILTLSDLSSATVSNVVASGTGIGVSGSALNVTGVAASGVVVAAGTIATTAAGTIATTSAGTIAFTGTGAALAEVSLNVNLSAISTRVFAQGI